MLEFVLLLGQPGCALWFRSVGYIEILVASGRFFVDVQQFNFLMGSVLAQRCTDIFINTTTGLVQSFLRSNYST